MDLSFVTNNLATSMKPLHHVCDFCMDKHDSHRYLEHCYPHLFDSVAFKVSRDVEKNKTPVSGFLTFKLEAFQIAPERVQQV